MNTATPTPGDTETYRGETIKCVRGGDRPLFNLYGIPFNTVEDAKDHLDNRFRHLDRLPVAERAAA